MEMARKSSFLSRRVLYLPVSSIRANPNQPRRHFDEAALRELAESIRQYGIMQPLTVRRTLTGYELIAGERRLRAAKIAGLRSVPCLLTAAGAESSSVLALIENIQRRNLHYFEEAAAIAQLIRTYGLSQEQAADKLGKSQSAVANKLRLLRLSREVQRRLLDYALSERHARALLPLKADAQKKAAAAVIEHGLNVRQTEALVKKLATQKKDKPLSPEAALSDSYGKLAAQELSTKLGRTCRIVSGKKKGKIELEYYGMDDLNDLLEALAELKQRKNGGTKA